MSEPAERRGRATDPLVETVLAAVDDPALVCDPTGAVRSWNDAAERLPAFDPAGPAVRVAELLDLAGDPVSEATETDEVTHATGVLAGSNGNGDGDGGGGGDGDGGRDSESGRESDGAVTVTCRPVDRDGDVTAVVVVVDSDVGTDDSVSTDVGTNDDIDAGRREEGGPGTATATDSTWEREQLTTILADMPVVLVGVGADGRVEYCEGLDFQRIACDREGFVGAPIERFESVSAPLVEGCRRALAGETNRKTATIGDRTFEVLFDPRREDGTVTGTVAVAMEVTDRERSRRELEATRERLNLALEGTDAGVYEWDIGENRVYWHETTSRLFGLDPDTTYRPREAFRERVHPEDREQFRERALEAVEGDGDGYLEEEYRIVRPDGEVRWLVTEGQVQYEDGDPDRLVGFVRDITDRKEREQRIEAREEKLRAVIESSADPIAMQDREGRYQVVNEAMVETVDPTRSDVVDGDAGVERSDLLGARPAAVFDRAFAERFERHRTDVLETERARVVKEQVPYGDDERTIQLTLAPYHGPDGDVEGTVSIARDITGIERQRDELETLTEIQDLVQVSVRALTAATTHEEIQETVCERLANSRFYEFAWIGEREPSSLAVEPCCAAGDADGYLDEVTITVDPSETGWGPGGEAYRSGEVRVVHDVADDPDFEPWREAALERGFRSVAAVPLTHGSTTHGVLVVYASEAEAFSRRELAGFRTLGEVVGFALSAAQYRRLVEADSVLDLEFAVRDDEAPFIVASGEHDCRFVIEHAAQAGNERVIDYLTVEGADPQLGERVADRLDAVEQLRELDGDDGPHYEMVVTGSVFQYLAEVGARGKRGVVEDGVGHLSVEAPGDVDIRQVTEAIEQRFAEADLSAKREKRRAESPWWHPSGDVDANLTDRQRAVLRAAFYSGYYEWPRETDSETLADSLDVAASTLCQHLRKGHRRILESMFES